MEKQKTVGILIYDDVEVLDFCGPFEVFSVAGFTEGRKPFDVFTVAEKAAPVRARNGLTVIPDKSFADVPARSEEHTSELQSLMRSSYAVFCLKKKNTNNN